LSASKEKIEDITTTVRQSCGTEEGKAVENNTESQTKNIQSRLSPRLTFKLPTALSIKYHLFHCCQMQWQLLRESRSKCKWLKEISIAEIYTRQNKEL
jgi:hypothetical protein